MELEPLRIVSLEEIEKLLTFLRQNTKKLSDEADQKAFGEILEHLETAKTMADDDRKKMCLYDACTKYVNQLAFRLFVEDNLDTETLERFRGYDTVKTVAEQAQIYTNVMRAKEAEITKAQEDYLAEMRPFEIFQAVISGMSETEAKQKQEEYLERQKQALGR